MPNNNEIPAAVISAAESSFFNSKIISIAARGIPVAKEIIPIMSMLLFGIEDTKEQQELRKIYGELGRINAQIEGLSYTHLYRQAIDILKQRVEGIYLIMNDKQASSLKDAELKELCDFLTPGVGATISNNYKSCISSVIRNAYGAELNDILSSKVQGAYPLGSSECQATAINIKLLAAPIGIIEYVDSHLEFAAEVTSHILSVCLAANDAFDFLRKNEEQIKARFERKRMGITLDDVLATIYNEKVISEIGDLRSPTFLFTRLSPSLIKAPSKLCGPAYQLVSRMKLNADGTGNANTNISISRKEGYVIPTDRRLWGGPHHSYGLKLEYGPSPMYWTASFSNNNTIGNFINLAGRNGGFLGTPYQTDGDGILEMQSMGSIRNNKELYQYEECIWQVKVRHNEDKELVFMLINKAHPNIAFANNHGFMVYTKPGSYRYEADNIDEYWTVKMFD